MSCMENQLPTLRTCLRANTYVYIYLSLFSSYCEALFLSPEVHSYLVVTTMLLSLLKWRVVSATNE